jgi:hypothetical protein
MALSAANKQCDSLGKKIEVTARPARTEGRQGPDRVGGGGLHGARRATSLLPGFMGKRQLRLSRLTTSAQDSFFPPTIVRRQIEAIRPKRACPGIALSLSSERASIG